MITTRPTSTFAYSQPSSRAKNCHVSDARNTALRTTMTSGASRRATSRVPNVNLAPAIGTAATSAALRSCGAVGSHWSLALATIPSTALSPATRRASRSRSSMSGGSAIGAILAMGPDAAGIVSAWKPTPEGLMIARFRRNVTFANVCSALALLIALGTGTAYAANTISSDDIIDGQVKTVDLGDAAVTSEKVADGAIGQAKIASGAVGSAQIASGAVGSAQLAPGAVGSAQLAPGSVGSAQLATGGVDGSKVADGSLTTADTRGADAQVTLNVKAKAVPAGGCSDVKLTVPGASAGEVALIAVQGKLPAGMIVTAGGVPSADTVTMKACNLKLHGKRAADQGRAGARGDLRVGDAGEPL